MCHTRTTQQPNTTQRFTKRTQPWPGRAPQTTIPHHKKVHCGATLPPTAFTGMCLVNRANRTPKGRRTPHATKLMAPWATCNGFLPATVTAPVAMFTFVTPSVCTGHNRHNSQRKQPKGLAAGQATKHEYYTLHPASRALQVTCTPYALAVAPIHPHFLPLQPQPTIAAPRTWCPSNAWSSYPTAQAIGVFPVRDRE